MIKRETFKQVDPLSTWSVEIPLGGYKARPLAAYGVSGDSLEWDSWQYVGGKLLVDFGIDPVAGELEYEYQVEGSTPVEGEVGVINLTITQNNMPK